MTRRQLVTQTEEKLKLVTLGHTNADKPALISWLTGISTNSSTAPIGVEFSCTTVNVESTAYPLAIWDTAGQERFKAITAAGYLRGSDLLLFVYNPSDQDSFETAKEWFDVAQHTTTSNVKKALIAHHIDNNTIVVTQDMGERLARRQQCCFFEVGPQATASVTADHLKEQLIRHHRNEISLPSPYLEMDTVEETEARSPRSELFSRQPSSEERCAGKAAAAIASQTALMLYEETKATSARSELFSRQPSHEERKEEENRALVRPTQHGSNERCTIM